ncbi:hypothetical protein CAEBREN_10896 [Caenorhabditis brenneri]|uniref:Uncharacterized protein n=1 Tax=Caenorhabditis brenneri TaxID=135651 RepID=G0PKQ9_CAEBE|nr:hypothetical protein CAEBREN_10896 [Caenorhabditis brenneri]
MARKHNHVNENKKWEKERAENAKTIAELKRTVQRLTDDAAVIQQNRLCLKLSNLAETLCNGTPAEHQIGHQMLELFLESVDFAEYVEKQLDAAENAEIPPENPQLLIDLRQLLRAIRENQNKPADQEMSPETVEKHVEILGKAQKIVEDGSNPLSLSEICLKLKNDLKSTPEAENSSKSAGNGSNSTREAQKPSKLAENGSGAQNAPILAENGSESIPGAGNPSKLAENGSKSTPEAENGSNLAPGALSAENAMILAENALKSLYLGLKSTPEAENSSKSAENGFKLSQGGQGAFKPYSKGSGAQSAPKSVENGSKLAPKAPGTVNAIILAENLSKLAENRSKSTPEAQNGSNAPKTVKNAPNPPAAARNPSNLAPGAPKLAPETPEIKKAQKTTQNSAKSVVNAPKWFQEAGIQSNLAWEVYEAGLAQKSPKPAPDPSKSIGNAPKSVPGASGAQNAPNLAPEAPEPAPDAKNAPKSTQNAPNPAPKSSEAQNAPKLVENGSKTSSEPDNPSNLAPGAPKAAPDVKNAQKSTQNAPKSTPNPPKTAKKAPKPVFAHELGNDVQYASQEALMAGLEEIVQQNQAPRTQRAPTPPPDLVLDDDFDEVKKNPILAEFGLGYMKDVVHPTGEDLKRLMNTLMQVSGIQSAVERESELILVKKNGLKPPKFS